MARYSLQFKKSVTKDLRSIPNQDVKRILSRIEALAEDPRGPGAKKLTNLELYRIRVGRYRVLYEIRDDVLVVIVILVAHRSGAYS
jgi:mRNA interferase RelE/StbE